jgi:hypothetical protein
MKRARLSGPVEGAFAKILLAPLADPFASKLELSKIFSIDLSQKLQVDAMMGSRSRRHQVLNENIKMNVPNAADGRRWERFVINKPALLVSVNQGLHGVASRKCQVIDLSMGGAGIQVITTIGLPDHYYLSVMGVDERLGVAEVYRNGARIGVRFIKPLQEYMLNRILRA